MGVTTIGRGVLFNGLIKGLITGTPINRYGCFWCGCSSGAFFKEKSLIATILGGERRTQIEIWHMAFVGTCTDTSTKIYLDGEAILNINRDTARAGFRRINFNGANDKDLRIGCVENKPEYAFEDGSIDEVAIWNRSLSETEIRDAMRGNLLAVSPKDKVATTWGNIKRKALQP